MNNYFEGWYYKHQKGEEMLALIPGRSAEGAFIQIVTNDRAYNVSYGAEEYRPESHNSPVVQVGQSRFSPDGIFLDIRSENLELTGELVYESLSPIKGDIMGPFRFLPMECRHSVVSMSHDLSGTLRLSGRALDFTGGRGYIEGDRGRSFPDRYTWIQCNAFVGQEKWTNPTSVVVSIARIPFLGAKFWGCICVVHHKGKEYRLVTYNGVKIRSRSEQFIELGQGKYRLLVEIPGDPERTDGLEGLKPSDRTAPSGHALAAPQKGKMVRTIHESPACRVRFRFTRGDDVLFDEISDHASFEQV